MRIAIVCWIAALALPAAAIAQTEPKDRTSTSPTKSVGSVRTPTSRIRVSNRVYVGETAPGFELASAQGQQVKLSRFRGDLVLLAFADRREELSPYRFVADSLRSAGVILVGVCRGAPRSLRLLAERDSLRFDLLSDSTGEVAAIYGAYDFTSSTTLPGYVLVDRRGIVRLVVLGQSLPPEELLILTRYALTGI
jgi:peroxiredoxin